VYSLEIDGNILNLSTSGWTYKSTFVLFDYETESIWYHLQGTDGLTCISGFYKDIFLKSYPALKTRWNKWKELYPQTVIMDNRSK